MNREILAEGFLWLAALVGGPLVGAKLFDLVVLAARGERGRPSRWR